MSIGGRIKAAREHLNMKQPEFAEKIGITQSQLSYIESDKRKANEKMLISMYINFKINSEWITKGIGQVMDGVDMSAPVSQKKIIQDADIMKMVIKAIEEYQLTNNLQLTPEVKSNIILSFYQYFSNIENVLYSDVKKSIEQSITVLVISIGINK